jgi:hypothetical protein
VNEQIDLEARLRASLAEQSRRAPAAGLLGERIIAAVDQPPPAHQRRRRPGRALLPLVAAASVAAVVLALVGVGHLHPGSHGQPAAQRTGLAEHTAAPTQALRSAATGPPSAVTSATASTAGADQTGLTDFRVTDLTFVRDGKVGWALGTADCLDGSGGTCSAAARTTDGGKRWHSVKPPPADVSGSGSCAKACVEHLRFATAKIGYAYGPSALFMTKDGGAHWTKQAGGGARALESLDHNVIRVSTKCTPGCPWQVQVAALGSSSWRTATTIDAGMSSGVGLARIGSWAFLAVFGHTSGGAQQATSVLWASRDDGAHWSNRGEPCPQNLAGYGEVDTTGLAAGEDGSVTVLCTPRQAGAGSQFTMTSTDSGHNFARGNVHALGRASATAVAAASAKTVLVSLADGTYRSTDGGKQFVRLGTGGTPAPGPSRWLGFEDPRDARAVSADGRTIWTTHDAGATWSAVTFH